MNHIIKSTFIFLIIFACARTSADTPAPIVTATDFQGEIISTPATRASVLYQDGGQSIAVPGGSLWVFGDTFRGHRTDPTTKPTITDAVSNTIALLPDGKRDFPPALQYFVVKDGIATAPLTFLANEDPKKLRMWPAGGVTVDRKIYLFYSMIEVTDDPGPWNFHGLGSGLAVADKPLSSFRRITQDGSWKFPVEPICVLPKDGFLYCYQVSDTKDKKGLILARVAAAKIEDPTAYLFFTGNDWSPKIDAATVILKEAHGQASIAWNPALKAFLLATSSDIFRPEEIQLRTAANPWGPWSRPARITVPPRAGKTTNLVYCTFIHPELSSADGREITMTFCRMLKGNWELSNPELVRVNLSAAK